MSIIKNHQTFTISSFPSIQAHFLTRMNAEACSMAHFGVHMQGYKECGSPNLHTTLCRAALPNNRTNWPQRTTASCPKFHDLMIQKVARVKAQTGGSQNSQLHIGIFDCLKKIIELMKTNNFQPMRSAKKFFEALTMQQGLREKEPLAIVKTLRIADGNLFDKHWTFLIYFGYEKPLNW